MFEKHLFISNSMSIFLIKYQYHLQLLYSIFKQFACIIESLQLQGKTNILTCYIFSDYQIFPNNQDQK